MYERIKNDPFIINLYKQIELYEDETGGWAYHNYDHALNVVKTIEELLVSLDYDQKFIEQAKIAGILHDIGALEGKDNHAYRSYQKSIKYFKDNNIELDDMDKVLEAIKIHSDGFDTDNIIALTLILGDKLDIEKTRIANAGLEIEGFKEIQYINNIKTVINNNKLYIEFFADEKINLEELNEFYFTKKVFKAIMVFSKKLNLEYSITMNNKDWKVEI